MNDNYDVSNFSRTGRNKLEKMESKTYLHYIFIYGKKNTRVTFSNVYTGLVDDEQTFYDSIIISYSARKNRTNINKIGRLFTHMSDRVYPFSLEIDISVLAQTR